LSSSTEHGNQRSERTDTELEGEIAGIREAIRLNWLELEHLALSQFERRAIRSNIDALVQTLSELLVRAAR
jgi:hypothetical protein